MVQVTEGTFTIGDESLFTKTWLPDGPPKAKMVMIHGFSDHMDRYYGFFPYLASRGIAVYGFDQRGWGRSVRTPAQRGRSGPTSTVLSDMATFIRAQLVPLPPSSSSAAAAATVPVFVLGHSMGGGQVAALAATAAYDDVVAGVRGWILEGPMLGFAPELQPHWATIAGGKLASRLAPNFHLHRPIPPGDVCRDPAVQASIAADALMHDTGTLEGLAGMLERADMLARGRWRLRPGVRSLVLMHGTADKATSFDKARRWFEDHAAGVPDRRIVPYEGFYHQLHADPGKEVFYKDVADWILERCDDDGGGAGEAEEEEEEDSKKGGAVEAKL